MSVTISTSTNANASGYSPSKLVALSSTKDALVVWFDGTNVKYSYATSPYSSWTTSTLTASIGGGPRWQAGLQKLSNDDVLVVTSNSSGNIVSYYFTYDVNTHSWSAGSPVTILSGGANFNGGSVPMDVDAQGRVWLAWEDNSHVGQIYYTTNNGTSWSSSTTLTLVSGGAPSLMTLAYIGDYIVTVFIATGAAISYQRVDAHDVTIGSWSTAAALPNSFVDNAANAMSLRGIPGSVRGVFIADEYSAIPAQHYNASTDTWSTVTNIGGTTSDTSPTLVSNGTDLFAVWSKFSAASNFSIVYKQWQSSTQTWDTYSTRIVPDGTNVNRVVADFSGTRLAVVYTVGTGSPYSVNYETVDFTVPPLHAGYTPRYIPRAALSPVHQPLVPVNVPRYVLRGPLATIATYTLNLVTRFNLAILQDLPTRFILAGTGTQVLKDLAARFRILQNSAKDFATRFRLRSADQIKDVTARVRLRSADQLRDIVTRFRQRSADVLKDFSTRARLRSLDQLRDVAARLRLRSADQLRDLITRVRLRSADRVKDLVTRVRLRSSDQLRDVVSRFRLAKFVDLVTRLRLAKTRDVTTRFILALSNQGIKDLTTRFRLFANATRDATTRFRLRSSNQIRDVALRIRLRSADQVRDIVTRLRVRSSDAARNIAARFRQAQGSIQDVATRFKIQLTAGVSPALKDATEVATNLLTLTSVTSPSLSSSVPVRSTYKLLSPLWSQYQLALAARVGYFQITNTSSTPMPTPNTTIYSTTTVKDINNALVSNLSVCSVLVKFPDGTSTTLSLGAGVTNLGSGQYQAKYDTKGVGITVETWTITAADGVTRAQFQFEIGVGYN